MKKSILATFFALVGTVVVLAGCGNNFFGNSSDDGIQTVEKEDLSGNSPVVTQVTEPKEPETEAEPEAETVTETSVTFTLEDEDGNEVEHTFLSDQLPNLVGAFDSRAANYLAIMAPHKIMGEHTNGYLRSSDSSMRRINEALVGFGDGVTKSLLFDQKWADQGTPWSPNAVNEVSFTTEELKAKYVARKKEVDALPKQEKLETYTWCVEDEIANNAIYTDMAYQVFSTVPAILVNNQEIIDKHFEMIDGYYDQETWEQGTPLGKDNLYTYDSSLYRTQAEIMSHLEKTDEYWEDSIYAVALFQYYETVGIETRTTREFWYLYPSMDDRTALTVRITDTKKQYTDEFVIHRLWAKDSSGKTVLLDEFGTNPRDGRMARFAVAKETSRERDKEKEKEKEKEQEQENHNSSSSSGNPNKTTVTEQGKDPAFGSGPQGNSTPGYGPDLSTDGSGGVSTDPAQKYKDLLKQREDEAAKKKEDLKNEVSDKSGGQTQGGTPPADGEAGNINAGAASGESTTVTDKGTGEKTTGSEETVKKNTTVVIPD